MRTILTAAILGTWVVATGCATTSSYLPVGPGATGGPAAEYAVPPEAPEGDIYVTSFGFTEMEVGPNQPGTMLHARLAVSNRSARPWVVDGRNQTLVAAGIAPQVPAFVNSDAGQGPTFQVGPGRANVFDLYYAVAAPLPGFAVDWNVDVGGRVVAEQTAFQRVDGPEPSYAPYPPYVVVGLGFGVGWWYGPHYPYAYRSPPVVRHYYYGPGRGPAGAWRGAPPRAWRATPPPTAWRGSHPPASGWRGSPPPATGWRGSPPPAHGWRGSPGRAPSRGGGWRH